MTRPHGLPIGTGGKHGYDFGDWTLGCGGGGLHLSAENLARFQARLRYTNDILDPIRRKLMDDNQCAALAQAFDAAWVAK